MWCHHTIRVNTHTHRGHRRLDTCLGWPGGALSHAAQVHSPPRPNIPTLCSRHDTGNYTLPEVGAYLTNLVGTCTQNWAGPVTDAPTSPTAASRHGKMSPGSTAAAVIVPLVLLAAAAAAFAIYYKRRREGGALCLTVAIPSVNRPSSLRIAKSPTSGQKKPGSATPAKPPRPSDASATTSPKLVPSTPPRKPPRA